MVQGLFDQTLPCKPGRSCAVERSHQLCTHFHQQPSLQQFLEQVMIPIPFSVVVQGGHKEVGALQPLNACVYVARGTIAAGDDANDALAQRCAESVQNRGHQQEFEDLRRLLGYHLVHQIVGNLDRG